MTSSTCTFTNTRDQQLHARLEIPEGAVRATAVFAHCFTCSKDLKAVRRIASALTDAGIAVLSFDFAGLGRSEGDFAQSTFAADVDDLVAAADYLREVLEAPSLLVGHSLGGAAVIMAAARIEEVVAVATIGAPADPTHVQHLFDDDLDTIRRDGSAAVHIGGRPFTVGLQLVEDLAAHRPSEVLGDLGAAVLIFHSPVDAVVGIDHAQTLYQAARHPKSFVSLDRADHLLSDPRDADYVATVTASWVDRYLPAQTQTADSYDEATVTARNTGGYATPVTARGMALVVDEPADVGGTETGLTPYDHLGVALASCTALTLRIVAEREDIPLDAVEVSVTHDKVHARDCAECEGRQGRVDRMRRTVTITGDMTDAQRDRLLAVTDRCPVHKTLTASMVIIDE
ncbi:bifunctional alpha/beta hydrolase/OsmC family protein [soil metagenome]